MSGDGLISHMRPMRGDRVTMFEGDVLILTGDGPDVPLYARPDRATIPVMDDPPEPPQEFDPCADGVHCCCCGRGDRCCDCGRLMP